MRPRFFYQSAEHYGIPVFNHNIRIQVPRCEFGQSINIIVFQLELKKEEEGYEFAGK